MRGKKNILELPKKTEKVFNLHFTGIWRRNDCVRSLPKRFSRNDWKTFECKYKVLNFLHQGSTCGMGASLFVFVCIMLELFVDFSKLVLYYCTYLMFWNMGSTILFIYSYTSRLECRWNVYKGWCIYHFEL